MGQMGDLMRLWLAASHCSSTKQFIKNTKGQIKHQSFETRMLLSTLECVQSIDRLSALLITKTLCWNVAYGSDNFTPDEALETSIVQGKTQMAVQSLAMTELQIGEWGKVCWKWQQKGPHSLQVLDREGRGANIRLVKANWKNNSFNRWWQ